MVAVVLAGSSCAARSFTWPSGPTSPAPEATEALAEATLACRDVESYYGVLGVTGQIGGRNVRGLASARLHMAVTARGEIGLEAYVSGQMVFRLGGTDARVLLLLREDNRVVIGPAVDIVEALIGVPLASARLLAVMTGCVSTEPDVVRAVRYDETVEVATPDSVMLLERLNGGWRSRAGRFESWEVDYRRDDDATIDRVGLRSMAGHEPVVALTLSVQDQGVDVDLLPTAFTVNLPAGATPMSIDELRASGPFAAEDRTP